MARSHVDGGLRRLDMVDAAVTSYLAHLLVHGIPKAKYVSSWRTAMQRDPDRVRRLAAGAVGARLAERLLTRGAAGPSRSALRLALCRQALLLRRAETLCIALRKLRDFAASGRRPPGLLWVVCGPDGVGKSTVIGALEGLVVRRIVTGVRIFHT